MSNHNNETYIFDNKAKLFTGILMAIGVVCLGLSYMSGTPEMNHMRFWTNFLHNSVFFTGIAFASVLFLACHALAWGGWVAVFKRVPEAMMNFLVVGAGLFFLLGVAVYLHAEGTELLYLWNNEDFLNPDHPEFDKLAHHKSSFVNPIAYFLTVVVVLIWSGFAYLFRKVSLSEDTTEFTVSANNPVPENVKKNRFYAAAFLPIAGFSSAFVIWQWVMSVDTHWYSTMFAWYATVSMWVSMLAMCFMLILYLRSKGHLSKFTDEHMHDIGKYIFGFSVFWTYLWFSQFMLIWYANNGEETQYFFLRFEQFKPIFFGNLLINFVAPFLTLMMNSSKRTVGTLGFIAGLVFFGHWLDFFQMIKPGVWYNYEHKMHTGHGADAHKEHTENTYHLNQAPKTVLTGYQGEQDGENHGEDDHGTAHEGGDHDHADGHDAHDGHDHDGDDHAHEGGAAGHDDHGHGGAAGHGDHHADGGHGHDGHYHTKFTIGVHIPGLLEFGCFAGFLGLFLFVTLSTLSKAPLYPPNDPYILESEHYDTGIGPDRGGHDHH